MSIEKKTLLNEQANRFAPCKETRLKEDGPDLEKQLLAGKQRPRWEKVGRLKVDGGKVDFVFMTPGGLAFSRNGKLSCFGRREGRDQMRGVRY